MQKSDEFTEAFLRHRKDKKQQQEEDLQKNLEELEQEHEELEDEALKSTRRALHQVMETEEVGIKTAEKLRQQGDKLDEVYGNINRADQNAVISRKDAKKVKKYNNICGIHFRNPFNKTHRHAEEAYHEKKEKVESNLTQSTRKPLEDVLLEKEIERAEESKSAAKESKKYRNEKDKEITENLDQIDNVVGNLKIITKDMSEEIDSQDAKLEAIDVVGSHVDVTVRQAQAKIRKFAY